MKVLGERVKEEEEEEEGKKKEGRKEGRKKRKRPAWGLSGNGTGESGEGGWTRGHVIGQRDFKLDMALGGPIRADFPRGREYIYIYCILRSGHSAHEAKKKKKRK